MSDGTQAQAGPVSLVCPADAAPAVSRLCTAIGAALREDGRQLQDEAPIRLVLEAETPQPGMLKARLAVEQGGLRQLGPQGELSAMDVAAIPKDRIDGFARTLLARTPLPSLQE